MPEFSNYYTNKNEHISKILSEKIIDSNALKKACWGGIPPRYRAKCWRIFLRTANFNNETYQFCLEQKKEKYDQELKKCKIDKRIQHQIEIDVHRIESRDKIINNIDYTGIFVNVLSLYAFQRPAVGYVQGMSDILIPFLYTFVSEDECTLFLESSVFYCFARFIDNLQDNYIDFQKGIIRSIKKMKGILEIIEPGLIKHMNRIGLEMHMFAFRWFNCFFVREFDVENILIIFDTLFASKNENYTIFARYFAITLIVSMKNEIMQGDLSDDLLYIQGIGKQRYSLKEIQILLSTSYVNQSIFNE